MQNKIKFVFIIFLVIQFSCRKNGKSTDEIKQQLTNVAEKILIPKNISGDLILEHSEVLDTTIVVKLMTNKECLIGGINKLQVYKDRIFILDSYRSKGLFEFDMNGHFVRKYGDFGKGPGEYTFPISFDIDNLKNEIVIYDKSRSQLMYFDLNGKFKNSKKIDAIANNFVIEGSGSYLLDTHLQTQKPKKESTNVSGFSVTRLTNNGKVENQFLPTSPAQKTFAYRSKHNFFKNETICLFNAPFNEIIYEVKKESLVPLFYFEFESKTLPAKSDFNTTFKEFSNKINENEYTVFSNAFGYFLVNNKLIFKIRTGNDYENYMYNLKTKNLNLISLDNDTKNFSFFGSQYSVYKDFIVSYAQPSWYLDYKKFNSSKYQNTIIERVIKNSKATDNPIIIFDKIKK